MDDEMTDAKRLRAYQIMTEPEPWEGLEDAEVTADLEPLRPEFVEQLVRGVQIAQWTRRGSRKRAGS